MAVRTFGGAAASRPATITSRRARTMRGKPLERAALESETVTASPGAPLALNDQISIRRILDHLGLSPPGQEPAPTPDVVRVPVDDEGREILAG